MNTGILANLERGSNYYSYSTLLNSFLVLTNTRIHIQYIAYICDTDITFADTVVHVFPCGSHAGIHTCSFLANSCHMCTISRQVMLGANENGEP